MEYRIKFNGVTTLSEARYAAAAGATWIGFPMDGALAAAKIQEIAGWLQGPELVGEYAVWPETDTRLDHFQILGLDRIEGEAKGFESYGFTQGEIVRVDVASDLSAIPESVILHAENPETWLQRKSEKAAHQWMVNLSSSVPDNLEWLSKEKPYAFSLDAIGEDQTGLRDFSTWDDWLDALENL
ncbi:MAG: hypothetical protein ACK5U7_02690 [Bacteroidota bacterium]|jgi:hypothetical protein